ncbi:MAG: hypothetical protein DRP84_06110 [Spirochaetes bacterium]|nr:MAG: hypothetical protein DRP84_06110 [Spirochaetota bacterium]
MSKDRPNQVLKLGDIVLILMVIIGLGFLSFNLYGNDQGNKEVMIIGQNFRGVYPIEKNRKIEVKGPLGDTIVVIEDGKAWIEYSPCREKICMKMGKISRVGQQVVCVPNRVLVEIEGRNGDIDAVSR